jgi:hypothetical protein
MFSKSALPDDRAIICPDETVKVDGWSTDSGVSSAALEHATLSIQKHGVQKYK